jgi:two-component system, NarL family, sensor kinase
MNATEREGDQLARNGSADFHGATDIKAALAAVNRLSRQLLTLQEEERQRIAIELHDSTSQHLIALELNLMNLRRKIAAQDDLETTLHDMELSLHEAQKEIRIFSYLLHPPHLELDGLKSTLERFIEGFARRSGLTTVVSVIPAADHLPLDLQRCVLRVVQEALANVHRHAEARGVVVSLALEDEMLALRIRDNGKGLPPDKSPLKLLDMSNGNGVSHISPGLGLPGMLARLQQFGGSLELSREVGGTEVVARVPLPTGRGRSRRVKVAPSIALFAGSRQR